MNFSTPIIVIHDIQVLTFVLRFMKLLVQQQALILFYNEEYFTIFTYLERFYIRFCYYNLGSQKLSLHGTEVTKYRLKSIEFTDITHTLSNTNSIEACISQFFKTSAVYKPPANIFLQPFDSQLVATEYQWTLFCHDSNFRRSYSEDNNSFLCEACGTQELLFDFYTHDTSAKHHDNAIKDLNKTPNFPITISTGITLLVNISDFTLKQRIHSQQQQYLTQQIHNLQQLQPSFSQLKDQSWEHFKQKELEHLQQQLHIHGQVKPLPQQKKLEQNQFIPSPLLKQVFQPYQPLIALQQPQSQPLSLQQKQQQIEYEQKVNQQSLPRLSQIQNQQSQKYLLQQIKQTQSQHLDEKQSQLQPPSLHYQQKQHLPISQQQQSQSPQQKPLSQQPLPQQQTVSPSQQHQEAETQNKEALVVDNVEAIERSKYQKIEKKPIIRLMGKNDSNSGDSGGELFETILNAYFGAFNPDQNRKKW
ncbi:hypothetical protein CYY_010016 [Polysphondylium violaceum]|uniref:Uncharacterized protein n=1 Tax=Polysphondylium violaceum TaxID=133409 RepID=A0A8J4PLB0_9MYCE|nr:hypothetical protein CYY_010016 [Polysphondylium violaceum]